MSEIARFLSPSPMPSIGSRSAPAGATCRG